MLTTEVTSKTRDFISALHHGIDTTGFSREKVALEGRMSQERLSKILDGVIVPNETEMRNLAAVMNGVSPDRLIELWHHSLPGQTGHR